MKSSKLLDLLRHNQQAKAFRRLYAYYPKVEKLILSRSGSKADAQDVFQEALIVLYRKAQEPDFKLTSKPETYLYSVSRFIWNDHCKRKKLPLVYELEGLPFSEGEDLAEVWQKEQRLQWVEQSLKKIGSRCRELLISFYYRSMSMAQIAKKMGLSSEKVAKNNKYRCIQKAKQLLAQSTEVSASPVQPLSAQS